MVVRSNPKCNELELKRVSDFEFGSSTVQAVTFQLGKNLKHVPIHYFVSFERGSKTCSFKDKACTGNDGVFTVILPKNVAAFYIQVKAWLCKEKVLSDLICCPEADRCLPFGNGRDGDLTVPLGQELTIGSDKFYTNLTVNGRLIIQGAKIYVQNVLNGNGIISADGANGHPNGNLNGQDGGEVFVAACRWQGNGTVSANGGNGAMPTAGNGGNGGNSGKITLIGASSIPWQTELDGGNGADGASGSQRGDGGNGGCGGRNGGNGGNGGASMIGQFSDGRRGGCGGRGGIRGGNGGNGSNGATEDLLSAVPGGDGGAGGSGGQQGGDGGNGGNAVGGPNAAGGNGGNGGSGGEVGGQGGDSGISSGNPTPPPRSGDGGNGSPTPGMAGNNLSGTQGLPGAMCASDCTGPFDLGAKINVCSQQK